jgi:hypothetical protein
MAKLNEFRSPRSWWLRTDSECSLCGAAFVIDRAFYCTQCDGAFCGSCIEFIRRTRIVWCRDCRPAAHTKGGR